MITDPLRISKTGESQDKSLETGYSMAIVTNKEGYLPVTADQVRRIVRKEIANRQKTEGQQESALLRSSSPKLLVRQTDDSAVSTLKDRFQQLVDKWKQDTEFASTVHEMATHPAYQQIIGLGPAAISFILDRLEENTEHWFWALAAITGEDPVPRQSCGKVDEMREAWLEWGRKNGYGSQARNRDKRTA